MSPAPSLHRGVSAQGRRAPHACAFLLLALTTACGGTASDGGERRTDVDADPQLVFWDALEALCGQAFEGRVVESVPADPELEGSRMVMHVRACDPGEIRIPFHVGEDRSRTWVLTTTAAGLRLEHIHRHEDGAEDAVSRYGGDSRGRGTASVQNFPADARTAEMVPAAAANVWSIELHPGRSFVYALRREGEDRRFRVEFDLTRTVPAPPAPWGG